MYLYKKILAAYDGSELSQKALRHAVEMTKQNKESELIVVSAVNPTGPMTHPSIYEQIAQSLTEQAQELIEDVKQTLDSLSNNTSTFVIMGNPAQKIVEFADSNKVDLIVMGSRGLGGIRELFLGSVSHNVLQQAHCPVLIIK
ncbi:universal stress protein [Bacillus taeanensis]|uniref:Universal stress protein n=1 Tax=Bacillus taeanensis TaxID=273032 RepID=A0A366XZW1_9BACI|nr:universal stress protein [Bacillus taeanensis]RBW70665.1 universal stress protein [Bacillus taeanensis]